MNVALTVLFAGLLVSWGHAQDIGADDLIGAAEGGGAETNSMLEADAPQENAMDGPEAVNLDGGAGGGEGQGGAAGKVEEGADNTGQLPAGEAGAIKAGEGGDEGSSEKESEESNSDDGERRAPAKDVENFVAFVYSPGPRDPFISPNAPSTIVQESQDGEDITLESLMAFAEKLKGDLGERIRVVGVSVPPSGSNPYALVIYASGRATKGGGDIVEALPPRTVSVETGLPVRYPEEETLFISKLAQLVAQSSPIRLKRDSRVGAVIFPIQTIDDRGVLVSLPGYDEPILLPVYRDIDPRTESDN